MSRAPVVLQTSMFEEDYLLRELGALANQPNIALTELVANAWDAGATVVHIVLPEEVGGTLTVEDDGHGMTPEKFSHRWMTLRYSRQRHQGSQVEFPPDKKGKSRRAYGRNGVGRHGLLCFANDYTVETWRDGVLASFVVGTQAGESPFVLKGQEVGKRSGHGTRLIVPVERHLPDPEEIRRVISTRFVHDPEFTVTVNGSSLSLAELGGLVDETKVVIDASHGASVSVIDSTRINHSSIHQGIAFWVGRRLVGVPAWSIGSVAHFDRRTRFARKYTIVVDTYGYESDVEADWTKFKDTAATAHMYQVVSDHVRGVIQRLAATMVEETSEDALADNRSDLQQLGLAGKREVVDFVRTLTGSNPSISPDVLSAAVRAVINLEKSRHGASLLLRLSELPADDVQALDRMLSAWSVKDALFVLDQIDLRLQVVEAISRLAKDKNTDELHTLHPLVLRSRWLFGPEFESDEYSSNDTLRSVAADLFKSRGASFLNDRKRPDIVVLPSSTLHLTGVEGIDPSDPTLVQMRNVLLIELKRGDSDIGRAEMDQAGGYVQDIATAGGMGGSPYIAAWVVGYRLGAKTLAIRKVSDESDRERGYVRAITYSQLVSTANQRLLRLRTILAERYEDIPTDALLVRVLGSPEQLCLAPTAVAVVAEPGDSPEMVELEDATP